MTTTTFKKGDPAFYPFHGGGRITGKTNRDGRAYLTFKPLLKETLVVHVPVDQIDEVGLRHLISMEDLDDVMAILRDHNVRLPSNWSRRYKNHQEKIKTGDLFNLVEVCRNLETRPKLSVAEKDMARSVRALITSELMLVLDMDHLQVRDILDEALGVVSEPLDNIHDVILLDVD